MSRSPTKRRRGAGRRVLFVALLLALLAIATEGGAFVVYRLRTGAWFSLSEVRAQQRQLAASPLAPDGAPAPPVGLATLHPYLGYTFDPARNTPQGTARVGMPISSWGFFDDAPPIRPPDPRELVVGIFGGSVAGMLASQASDVLAAELRADPRVAARRVRFVRLALGGYKQPQQLIALSMLLAQGAHFDVVVNLDGFNEVVLPRANNERNGVHPSYPYDWSRLASPLPSSTRLRAIGRVEDLGRERAERARTQRDSLLAFSVTTNLLWSLADEALATRIAEAEATVAVTPATATFATRGPAFESPVPVDTLIDVWRRSSIQMSRLCDPNGIRYVHVLQPNQYDPGSKPLTNEERRNAFDEASPYRVPAETGYPGLRAAMDDLARAGVRCLDLSRVFATNDETLYVDTCCHLNVEGSAILARAIARFILADDALLAGAAPPPASVLELTVAPTAVRLERPFARRPLEVTGRATADARVDLTFAGVEYSSSDRAVAVVDPFGEIEARGVGRAVVTVRRGEHRLEVPVEVRFPPIHDLGGATSPRTREVPRLQVERSAEGRLTVHVSGLDSPRTGVLMAATAADPQLLCGGRSWIATAGAVTLPLAAESGSATLTVPGPGRDGPRTLYLQGMFQDEPPACGFTLTNAIAVTVD